MMAADLLKAATQSADALLVVTGIIAFYFRQRALAKDPKEKDGKRPSWGGEVTGAPMAGGAAQTISSLWNKLLLASLGLAVVANLAGTLTL